VGLDVGAIGSSSLVSFGSGRRFYIWLFIFILNFKQNPASVIPAEGILFPHHRQYSVVMCHQAKSF